MKITIRLIFWSIVLLIFFGIMANRIIKDMQKRYYEKGYYDGYQDFHKNQVKYKIIKEH